MIRINLENINVGHQAIRTATSTRNMPRSTVWRLAWKILEDPIYRSGGVKVVNWLSTYAA